MKDSKKSIKEQRIVEAAEKVFLKVGFKNAKMEDIAAEAGITKVTLYSYFQSKENLQMAVTYKALSLLIDKYYETINENKTNSGLESTLATFKLFIDFNEENFLYSEALMAYFELNRSSGSGANKERLTEALRESVYFRKIQDIQNLPFKLTIKEIERGKIDGSIKSDLDPMVATLAAWSVSIGYIKLTSATGTKPLFNVDMELLKKTQMKSAAELLSK